MTKDDMWDNFALFHDETEGFYPHPRDSNVRTRFEYYLQGLYSLNGTKSCERCGGVVDVDTRLIVLGAKLHHRTMCPQCEEIVSEREDRACVIQKAQ